MAKEMTLAEIVLKLVGPVEPVGETTADNKSFENLKALVELTNKLIRQIDWIATTNSKAHEFSVKRSGEYAFKAMTSTFGISNFSEEEGAKLTAERDLLSKQVAELREVAGEAHKVLSEFKPTDNEDSLSSVFFKAEMSGDWFYIVKDQLAKAIKGG